MVEFEENRFYLEELISFISVNTLRQTVLKSRINSSTIQQNQQLSNKENMRASTKSHHITEPPKDPQQPTTNPINNPKSQSPLIPHLKLPPKQQHNNKSLSRKIYILTDHEDQIVQSIPTAKHTFMSQQVEMGGDKGLDRFYTPRKKDDRQEEKEKERAKFRIEPDVNSELQNVEGSARTKGQRSRFYYKAEDYESLDSAEVGPDNLVREGSKKQESMKQEAIKQGVNKSEKGVQKQKGGKQQGMKEKSVKQQIQKQDSLKKQQQQTPKSNTKMLSSYISKMNTSKQPYTPVQQQQQTQGSPFKKKPYPVNQSQKQQQQQHTPRPIPRSSRFPQPLTNSSLQQSHQKLFNKCYKQTYSHLKLMLRQIHQSQEQMHIIHKEITDTVFQIIKERAEAIRQEMKQLVEEIVEQWMRDEWEYVKSSQIQFMDDILELQSQLSQRQQEIRSFVDRLVNQNKKHQNQNNDQAQQIFHTFNGKKNMRTSMESSRTQTTWKKVTTDLLMFNYQSNIIEIQQMIEKIGKSSLDKCNKAVDMLPSTELFKNNSHEEVLNQKAKKWFRQAMLEFMNVATMGKYQPYKTHQGNTRNTPNKDNTKKPTPPQKTYHKKQTPASPQYQQYQQIIDSIKAHQEQVSSRRHAYQKPQEYYPQEQVIIDRAYQESVRRRQRETSPKKLYLDKTYYASGRGGVTYS